MALIKKPAVFTTFIWISLCSSQTHNIDYPNGSGANAGGMTESNPFVAGSGGISAGFGGQMQNGGGGGNGNGMGINPFSNMAKGKGSSPFASAAGTGDGNGSGGMGAGPFASGMNNAGGGGSFNGGGGSGNSGAGPFSSGTAGNGNSNGASPFASALGNGGGNSNGVGPFAGGMSGKGSSPFNANMDSNGGMSGVDLSSLMNLGPGGLAGGAFLTSNISKLMGHDYSKDMGSSGGQFGEMSLGQGQSENKIGVDNSRFDTTAYQHMLQQLFSTDNSGQELKDMGTPFDGSAYTSNYNNNGGEHQNTAMEASVGSFASTDMSSYAGNRDKATGQTSSQYAGLQKGNAEQYTGSDSGGSNMASSGSGNGGTYSNPFDVNNYDMGHVSPNSGGATGMGSGSNMNKGQNPFDTSNYNAGKNTLSINSNYNGAGATSGNGGGTGGGPFDTSKFGTLAKNSNKQSGSGQNPFDTSKYQASGTFSNMMGNQQYQNMGTGNVDYNKGLDEYGNVNFGTLSGSSGNTMDTGAAGGLGVSSHLSGTGSYSTQPKGSSSYTRLQDGTGNGQYRTEYTGMGSTYSGTRTGYNAESKSQYETPFEADNYNDLLGNPFKSDSYFDTTKQNFKIPYETNSNLQQSSYSNSGPSAGYGGGQSLGSGPAGDPFHQGGNSMGASNAMRG